MRVLLRPWECCILSQPLWAPLQSLLALSWPLLAPLRPLLALSWPLLHSHGPCKHVHASATVSRPLVALSRPIQALPLPLQHFYGLYMQSHGLSCEILPTILQNIYFYCSYTVQKKFLKAMRGHLEQCCGSGMLIPDPGSWFLPIPDPGSRIPDPKTATKKRGEKKLVVKPFYVATNVTKL